MSADREVPPLPDRVRAADRTTRGTQTKGGPGVGESGGSRLTVQFEKFIEDWHPRVREWWQEVWTSPMAEEYLGADVKGGLYLLAELHQRRWTETQTAVLIGLAAEIRQQEIRFGLSPIDRRRLQWSVEQGETAVDRTAKRRSSKRLNETSKKDPRDVLGLVK